MKKIILFLLLSSLMACQPKLTPGQDVQMAQANVERIKAHISFLADDLLEGRDTGSRGHEVAALYIASQFAQLGLETAGDKDSYLQRINFRQAFLQQDSPKLSLTTDGTELVLNYPNDYLTFADPASEYSNVEAQLVFVGYGIVAAELNHDDYAGLDVQGKIVVVLSGKPKSFPSEEGAHFGSRSEKNRYAQEHGAVGMITVVTPQSEKTFPYKKILKYTHTPSVRWLDDEGQVSEVFPGLKNSVLFTQETAAILFANADLSLEQIYALLEEDKSPQGFELAGKVSMSKISSHTQISSPNVVAILPGSDPLLKNEYVVYSAHADHLGITDSAEGDKINNGAMDNATGTATLIETARLLSEGKALKRSMLFLAVTGEEKGLLGSSYYAQNPTVDINAIVATVNLDMPILSYEFADIIAFGANHSDMQQTVETAAKLTGLSLSPDPMPEEATFTRSDHYNFVKQGVPSVYVVPGFTAVDPKVSGEELVNNFLHNDYHQPSDELTDAFNWPAAKKFAEVNLQIGIALANQAQRPKWNEGDFFGNTFAKPDKH